MLLLLGELLLSLLLVVQCPSSAFVCATSSPGQAQAGSIVGPSQAMKEKLRLLVQRQEQGIRPAIPEAQRLVQAGNKRSFSFDSSPGSSLTTGGNVVSFCPSSCSCNITLSNQLQVVCEEYYEYNFPIATLRKDVEVLKITPKCRRYADILKKHHCLKRKPNRLSLGPHFQYLRLLKVLVITDSNIPNIGTRTLWGLSGLRVLNLSGNRLSNVVDKNFDGLYSLKEIYFDNNVIRSLVSAAFRHVNQLEILSLRNNKIEELAPRIFYKLSNLKLLDLSGNRLEHIDGGVFQDTPALETLACRTCGLFQLQLPLHVNLPKLHSLFLGNNSFYNLSRDVHLGFIRNIQNLDLSHNRLNRLGTLPSAALTSLNVARNNISVVEKCAFCNGSIKSLNLGFNRIVTLGADAFQESLHSLTSLSLSGNWMELSSLRALLPRLESLQNLDLDHTGLVNVPVDLFQGNPELKHLNLSQNLLVDVEPSVFSHLERLETMDLSSNFLMGLSMEFFQEVERKSRLRMVYLQANHWKCDKCHIQPLIHFLKNSLMYWGACFKSDNPMCLKCAKPDDFLHRPIEELALSVQSHDSDDPANAPVSLPECEAQFYHGQYGTGGYPNAEIVRDQHGGGFYAGGGAYGGRAGSRATAWDTNSPYLALGLAALVVTAAVVVLAYRYRHYGVYMTHEEAQLVDVDDELVRNPVVVLDRNSESYINLKYPVMLPADPGSATAGLANGNGNVSNGHSSSNGNNAVGVSCVSDSSMHIMDNSMTAMHLNVSTKDYSEHG